MSRCFPFPPPGYERKHIFEDLLVLKEAKLKEKKEKRERRDKEKKKYREKTEKDHHGDRKERKEKHRDKKEKIKKHGDKNKDEDKEKETKKGGIALPEKSTVAPNLDQLTGNKLHPESHRYEGTSSVLYQGRNGVKPFDHLFVSETATEAKFVHELNKRIKDDTQGKVSGSETAVFSNHSMEMVKEKVDSRSKIEEIHGDVNRLLDMNSVDKQKSHSVVNDMERQELRNTDKRNDTKSEKPEKSKLPKPENDGKIYPYVDANQKNEVFLPNVGNTGRNDENVRKRKDAGINGFLHDNDLRPKKITRLPKNGSKLVYEDLAIQGHAQPNKEDQNLPPPPVPAPKSASRDSGTTIEEHNMPTIDDLLSKALKRPPHPDSKFLSQVLSVPRVGEWSEYDDQEWLFSTKDPPEKPDPKSGRLVQSSETETTHVSSKAVRIESADIYALPYVIPY